MLGSRPAIDFAARLRVSRPSLVGAGDNIHQIAEDRLVQTRGRIESCVT
jgi:hypothetical protein